MLDPMNQRTADVHDRSSPVADSVQTPDLDAVLADWRRWQDLRCAGAPLHQRADAFARYIDTRARLRPVARTRRSHR
jgi:hypothetical protein